MKSLISRSTLGEIGMQNLIGISMVGRQNTLYTFFFHNNILICKIIRGSDSFAIEKSTVFLRSNKREQNISLCFSLAGWLCLTQQILHLIHNTIEVTEQGGVSTATQ